MRRMLGLGLLFAFIIAIVSWVEELVAQAFPSWQYSLYGVALVVSLLTLLVCGYYFQRLLGSRNLAVLSGLWAGFVGGLLGAAGPIVTGPHAGTVQAVFLAVQAAFAMAIYGGLLALLGSLLGRMNKRPRRTS